VNWLFSSPTLIAPQIAAMPREIGRGIWAFAFFAFIGLGLIWKGIKDDRYDWLGNAKAERFWYFLGGAVLIAPLVVFLWFCSRQGVL
jgi:hypothetical protein